MVVNVAGCRAFVMSNERLSGTLDAPFLLLLHYLSDFASCAGYFARLWL
jgi:hypothetical protein